MFCVRQATWSTVKRSLRNPTCSWGKNFSTIGLIWFRIKCSVSLNVVQRREMGRQLFGEASSFPGFSRAITDALCHIFGIWLLWKHVSINSVSQVIAFSPRFTKNSLWMPSGPGDFPSLSWLRPTLTSSMVNSLCRSGLSVLHNHSDFSSLIICLSNFLSLDSVRPFRTTCLPMSFEEMDTPF